MLKAFSLMWTKKMVGQLRGMFERAMSEVLQDARWGSNEARRGPKQFLFLDLPAVGSYRLIATYNENGSI